MVFQKVVFLLNRPLLRILNSSPVLFKNHIPVSGWISQVKYCHDTGTYDDQYRKRDIFKRSRPIQRYDNEYDEDYESSNQENSHRPKPYAKSFKHSYANNYYDEDRGYHNRETHHNPHRSNYQRNDYTSYQKDLRPPNWKSINLAPIEKNFYVPSERMKEFTEEEINQYRESNNMTLIGKHIPVPIQQFSDYVFPESFSKIFHENGYENPTSIQAQGWPICLSGRDFIGVGETGSGKTLGYVLPAVIHVNQQPKLEFGEGPLALVLVPTRELAQQIHAVTVQACRGMNSSSVCIYGGAGKGPQSQMLRNTPSICIATPGRLLDFLEMEVTNLRRCSFLVLDEADRMLDMGFEPQIRKIINQIRPDRQTVMWSATWPEDVQDLANDFISDHIRLNVGTPQLSANKDVTQYIEFCDSFQKSKCIEEVVHKEFNETASCKILIFCDTQRSVEDISRKLYHSGIKSRAIHGRHSQTSRDSTLAGFRRNAFPVLVATNVVARGLDVMDITTVINYDFPNDIEDYVHRIGRTGRAGRKGKSISLMTTQNSHMVNNLIKVMKESDQEIPDRLYDLRSSDVRMKRQRYSRGSRFRENSFGKSSYF